MVGITYKHVILLNRDVLLQVKRNLKKLIPYVISITLLHCCTFYNIVSLVFIIKYSSFIFHGLHMWVTHVQKILKPTKIVDSYVPKRSISVYLEKIAYNSGYIVVSINLDIWKCNLKGNHKSIRDTNIDSVNSELGELSYNDILHYSWNAKAWR